MKISKSQLRKIIIEETENLEYDLSKNVEDNIVSIEDPEEIEALEDAWAGGTNIHQSVDHAKAQGLEANTLGVEVMPLKEYGLGMADDPHGDDADYELGYQDGFDGYPPRHDATADYDLGYEDGTNDANLHENNNNKSPKGVKNLKTLKGVNQMKITKRQLKRIIAEECAAMDAPMAPPALDLAAAAPAALSESATPEAELVIEMDTALSGLQQVAESLDAASMICQDCVQEVAAQGPILQAVATQAAALQETLAAVEQIVAESVDPGAGLEPSPVEDAALPQEIAAAVQLEVRRRRLQRRR